MYGDIVTESIAPGGSLGVPGSGALFAFKSETNGNPIDLLVNGSARRLEVGDVSRVPSDPKERLRIVNPNAVSVIVRYYIGDDEYRAAKVSGTVTVKNFAAGTLTGSGDQSIADATTDTIAENVGRREVVLQADHDNSGPLYLRDSGGNNFARLNAGQSMTIEATAEFQVRNDTGSSQTYRYSEHE